jgi:hypothetical protein
MTYVRCPGCDTIHESTLPVCPGCGRCPACGERRATSKYIAEHVACPACGLPYCDRCWRCHGCGKPRYIDAGTCTCGFPDDPAKLAQMEQAFSLSAKPRGCLSLITELARAVILGRVKQSSGEELRRPPDR